MPDEQDHWNELALTPQRVESYQDLLAEIARLTSPPDDEYADVEVNHWVFRGQADATWTLESSLYRAIQARTAEPVIEQMLVTDERLRISQARHWLRGWEDPQSDPELLATMQHLGVPTRLLDVTSNPLTALWMACRDKPDADGVLIGFEVAKLTQYVTTEAVASDADIGPNNGHPDVSGAPRRPASHPSGRHWDAMLTHSQVAEEPFLLVPALRDRRMLAQEGMFLGSATPPPGAQSNQALKGMHAPRRESDSYDHLGPPNFDDYNYRIAAIIFSAGLKPELLTVLRNNFDRSERSMFPDLVGMRDYYRDLPRPVGLKDSPTH